MRGRAASRARINPRRAAAALVAAAVALLPLFAPVPGAVAAAQVYASDLASGDVAAGWPVAITTRSATEHVWGALTLANSRLYVTIAGICGDRAPFNGRVMAIDPAQPALVNTFVTVPARDGGGGGICGSGGAPAWPATRDVYAASATALNAN